MGLLVLLPQSFKAHPYLSLVAGTAALSISYLVLRAIYRITLHPLCGFPGPKLRAISHLPDAIAGAKGKQAVAVRDLHEQYGEVVRIKPDFLSFMTPGAWKDIYGHAASKRFRKHGYFKFRGEAQPITLAEDEDYVRQRAALAHGFSERAINGQEETLTQHVDRFIEQLKSYANRGDKINMSEWLHFLTFDVIGEFALNMQFGCVDNKQNHPWVAILVKWLKAVSFAANATAFGLLAPFMMIFADFKNLMGIQTHLKISAEKVQERLKMGDDPNKSDLWAYVLRNKGDKSLSQEEMEVNAATLLVAGTAPVTDTLCGAVYLLAKNREALGRLQKEIGSHVQGEHDLTMSTTAKMPYLQAVLSEAMRCYTSSPGGGTRKTPPEGATISGYSVPGGTIVCVYQLPAYTLPANFALPESFLPERWLPADDPNRPRATLSDKQDVFQPFSYGPRGCLGKGLAYAEMKLVLARFVWNFDFELLDNDFAFEKQKAFLFRERPALNMKLSNRHS